MSAAVVPVLPMMTQRVRALDCFLVSRREHSDKQLVRTWCALGGPCAGDRSCYKRANSVCMNRRLALAPPPPVQASPPAARPQGSARLWLY